jgi:hypothetical protein
MLLLEPDFGTALMLSMLLYFMLFIGGARVHHLVGTGLMALPVPDLCLHQGRLPDSPPDEFFGSWSDAPAAAFTSFNR